MKRTNDEFATTAVRLTTAQFEKLHQLANHVGVSRNRVFGMLVDNAMVEEVKRMEPVAKLVPVGKKNRQSATRQGMRTVAIEA